MASTSHSAFSHDGQFLAVCGTDGKLKIFETATSRLKQEFVPNLHLSSPCSILGWIVVGTHATTAASPWKKRRKKSINEDKEDKEIIAMGSTNGNVTLYDISTSSINDQLENGHNSSITALTWCPHTGLFTAAEDKQIVQWNLQEKSVKCKWKSGKGKVTSLVVLPKGKSLLSGERIIKWWDLETKQVIGTFTGHANQVNTLCCAKVTNETSYLFSSGSGDDYLSVWSLNEVKKDKVPVATLILPDEAVAFSVASMKDSQIHILAVTRSGHAQFFKYQPNGTSPKPLKPTLNILIASDAGQKESVQQIPILQAELIEDSKILLAYGSFSALTIEKIVPDFSDKVQCLVRTDIRKQKDKKDEVVMKTKSAETEDENVVYIAPGASEAGPSLSTKRSKSGTGSQLPLKIRLENLSMNEESTPNKAAPKGENLAQLLIQGLHSGDKALLSTVLYVKKESVIKNTVAKLPVQAIVPLIKELTTMLEGKTVAATIAVVWLKALLLSHTASIIAQPNIGEILAPILSFIDAKQQLLMPMMKLKGRVELIAGQIEEREEKQEKDITEECLLVYEDQDSSDENVELGKVELDSESDDNWEETSDQEKMQEDLENGKSEDDASICSSDS
ncbi:WD repeat-containing protein 43 [Phymastichus coffea]|uniref:WD repeat-containing protein 43 n=1 Tax=Phymastichus coffea TaxID=108790 RepID=UPI00273B200C|nr:WD repeat-containing protein 43 [Phymastichus coffea]